MRRFLSFCSLLPLLAGTSCHRAGNEALADAGAPTVKSASLPAAPTPVATGPMNTTAVGTPYGLRIEGETISFCDTRGGRRIDDVALARPCAKDGESNTTCSDLGLDVEVSTPNRGPNDLVDVSGSRFPLQGRVHDCAADGKTLAIVTGSAVVLIDTAPEKTQTIDHQGGERVAISKGWIAWTRGTTVHARHR